eukprot:TRINITY_DN10843_c0_g1_i3.p1 TRINITY_DN10843_c0_g1~~TRINITY_DN10843_c0_g1_i3.p1  ORF type:complete len:253 (+),score=43.40 TRINITY_DN10843_c0_g1_i3:412-1170(+)
MLSNVHKLILCCDSKISLPEIYWAYSAFSSRAVGMSLIDNFTTEDEVRSETVIPCLVPLVDTFNHCPRTKVKFLTNISEELFRYECDYDPESGIEVFNNYGNKTNEEFILSYGFYLTDNPHNTSWIQLALSIQDPLYSRKKKIFTKFGLSLRHHLSDGVLPVTLLQATRVLLLSEEEIYFFAAESLDFVSNRNECLLYQTLIDLMASKLNNILHHHPHTDMDSLLKEGVSYNKEMALRYKMDQKVRFGNLRR